MEIGKKVASQQQANGGVPFGLGEKPFPPHVSNSRLGALLKSIFSSDFEYAPDLDDTAESILFWNKFGGVFQDHISSGVQWLLHMQNDDGGCGAFDKNRNGSGLIGWLIELLASQFAGSAEIFDPSSVDVTAHVLESFGAIGINVTHPGVQKAVAYIKGQQRKNAYFIGRWAINAVYCTGATLVGLARVGYNLKEQWIANSVTWLAGRQNADGGFGESFESYNDESWIGRGVSTPTQTAWAIFGLLEAERQGHTIATPAIERAIVYLVESFRKEGGKFLDRSIVGTGHPGIVRMHYPSYAMSFPLAAIARYYLSRIGPVPVLDI